MLHATIYYFRGQKNIQYIWKIQIFNMAKKTEEDYLKEHIDQMEAPLTNAEPQTNTIDNATRATDLQYIPIDINELPCGQFYPTGTVLMVRPAQVREIQSYSMVDDNNVYDIIEKMNDMLQSCVRIKFPDNKMGSFLDLKDQDRIYTIFLIRELTFQKGNTLAVDVDCACGAHNQLELKRENFKFHEMDEKIARFYKQSSNSFNFDISNGKSYNLTIPNIGVQKAFTEYIIRENADNKKPNMSFLKIIPYMLEDRNSITYEGIKSKLGDFQAMDDISFQFLNAAVGKLALGVEGLKTNCTECGVEVHTEMTFPNGASGIFVIHDAFETFIKK